MAALINSSTNTARKAGYYMPYVLFALIITAQVFSCGAFATQDAAFSVIFSVGKYIAGVLGVIFIFVGIIRYIIANNNDSGPDMQKAAQMLATGIVLTGIGAILTTNFFSGILPTLDTTAGGGN